MQHWMKKIFVVVIAILTLGVYVPPLYVQSNADTDEVSPADPNASNTESIAEQKQAIPISETAYSTSDYVIKTITEQAKTQTLAKLGPRIIHQVEDEFTAYILPALEEVVDQVLTDGGEDAFTYYGITEKPSSGYGEKIFHIYDVRTKKDVARFHVRRDNRPQEGYWFNFHYHLSKDGFEKHHQIGEIYWDKNTPPKWMA